MLSIRCRGGISLRRSTALSSIRFSLLPLSDPGAVAMVCAPLGLCRVSTRLMVDDDGGLRAVAGSLLWVRQVFKHNGLTRRQDCRRVADGQVVTGLASVHLGAHARSSLVGTFRSPASWRAAGEQRRPANAMVKDAPRRLHASRPHVCAAAMYPDSFPPRFWFSIAVWRTAVRGYRSVLAPVGRGPTKSTTRSGRF